MGRPWSLAKRLGQYNCPPVVSEQRECNRRFITHACGEVLHDWPKNLICFVNEPTDWRRRNRFGRRPCVLYLANAWLPFITRCYINRPGGASRAERHLLSNDCGRAQRRQFPPDERNQSCRQTLTMTAWPPQSDTFSYCNHMCCW